MRLSSYHDFGFPNHKSYPIGTPTLGQQLLRGQWPSTLCAWTRGAILTLSTCIIRREDLEKCREGTASVASCFLAHSVAERRVVNIQKL